MRLGLATHLANNGDNNNNNSKRPSLMTTSTTSAALPRRVTSTVQVALQFYWQGYPAYVKKTERENVAPCFDDANCDDTANEYVRIVPVDEVPERSILDGMKVQVLSVASGKYLRATRMSKYLRWSDTRDEQTVFQIQILDGKRLTTLSKFTLASCFRSSMYVGFSQTFPLGGTRDLVKAIGFLTMEKKKNQPSLLFPLRMRAVPQEERQQIREEATSSSSSSSSSPTHANLTPLVTGSDLIFVQDEEVNQLDDVPLAIVMQLTDDASARPEDDHFHENCTYCGLLFRRRSTLLEHIEEDHEDWLSRPCVPGSFCVHCGRWKEQGHCAFCEYEVARVVTKLNLVRLAHSLIRSKNMPGQDDVKTTAAPVLGKSGKKICCSCPDTKKVRDLCVVQNGEENCADVIEAHKACLRAEGFTVK
ncbi:TPA: hypothetical protein N0F65_006403 [Lagenidium giganteum]|uniref:C2H2-type domain-containing protein n=1 Tax=Lagenidium giganteum TaxID=4803 RepID=A0AAV2YP42_9STRA|nr:TPA: hypothetical protein N0F65_006403 [Lagenidium giganteum]